MWNKGPSRETLDSNIEPVGHEGCSVLRGMRRLGEDQVYCTKYPMKYCWHEGFDKQ